MPTKTPPAVVKRVVSLRLRHRLGPVQLAPLVGVAPSTVHRVLARCRLNRLAHVDRALAGMGDHPNSLYVREDAILSPLDHWIESPTSPEALENHEHPSSPASVAEGLKAELAALDRKISGLVAAVEAGADLPQLTDQLKRRARERAGLEAELRALPRERRVSAGELRTAIEDLGGIANVLSGADPTARQRVYESLGLRLEYDHAASRIIATATQACVFNRVRRGT